MRNAWWGGLVVLALLLVGCRAGADGPEQLDTEAVALGREVYRAHCAACHGAEGEGAADWLTPNELGELPAPPHDSTGHTWKHSDGMLYRIVSDGWRDPFNRHARLTMPAFGNDLSARELRAVITYMKTWWTREQRQFQWQESQDEPFPQKAANVPRKKES